MCTGTFFLQLQNRTRTTPGVAAYVRSTSERALHTFLCGARKSDILRAQGLPPEQASPATPTMRPYPLCPWTANASNIWQQFQCVEAVKPYAGSAEHPTRKPLINEDFCPLARKTNSVNGEYIQHIRPVGGMRMTPPGGKKTINQRFSRNHHDRPIFPCCLFRGSSGA